MPDPKVTLETATPKRKNSPIKLEDIYNLNVEIGDNLRKIKNDVAEIKSFNGIIDKRTKVLEECCEKLKEKSVKIDQRLNAMEQLNLKSRMEIKGISENELENVDDMKAFVVEILRKFKVTGSENLIQRAYKKVIHAPHPFSLIIVWFNNEDEKERIMREKFENQKRHKIKSDIYFNHCLTNFNRALYTKALKSKSTIGMEMVFIRNGKIAMKQNRQSKPLFIHTFEELDMLLFPKTTEN